MSDYVYVEPRVMRVSELRALVADLPDDDYIFVDGYEGGYDMPRLELTEIPTLEPWVKSSSHCGPWRESRGDEDRIKVWVLAREG